MSDASNGGVPAAAGGLLPCPFCGTDDPQIGAYDAQGKFFLMCRNPDCAARTAPRTSHQEVVGSWNRRVEATRLAVTADDCRAWFGSPEEAMPITTAAVRYQAMADFLNARLREAALRASPPERDKA